MGILVFNCGSSSLKFQLFTAPRVPGTPPRRLEGGLVDRLGHEAILTLGADGRVAVRRTIDAPDHGTAVRHALETLGHAGLHLEAVGHRVVHGGERFPGPAIIDPGVIEGIAACEELAPLHNAAALEGIRAARALLPTGVPMVAVFDTSFHASLPERARRYAIPRELADRHGIRRYGFHGLSYQHVLQRYAEMTGVPGGQATIVALHLGNGASAAAIRDGVCVDTSMGLTPLEGLVMGTRSGDIDPYVPLYLARRAGVTLDEVYRKLNEESGLLGLSGRSSDMRDLLECGRTDPRAALAVEMFCYRARKYVGAYLAALDGAQAVVFTGGIGENSPGVRGRILAGMEWCGLKLDDWRNREATGREAEISDPRSRVRVLVIPADEEMVIARETASLVTRGAAAGSGPGGLHVPA